MVRYFEIFYRSVSYFKASSSPGNSKLIVNFAMIWIFCDLYELKKDIQLHLREIM